MISALKPTFPTAIAAFAAALTVSNPAVAQDKGGDKVNMVIAYSEEECPEQSEEGEIVICEILVEADRYRIPKNLRTSDSPQNQPWTRQVEQIRYIGDFGTLSCDPAGAGGFTGCTQQMIDLAYQEKREGSAVRFAQLIEQARQERLASIDTDAAAEQERVEQIEREYLERLERERAAALPGEITQPLPTPEASPEPASDAPAGPPLGPVDEVAGEAADESDAIETVDPGAGPGQP